MSNYDLTAIASDPELYLSSSSSTDQSGKAIYVITNGSQNIGQPIIAGNSSALIIDSTHSIDIDANPIFFRSNCHMEFVAYFTQPTESVCIFGDDDAFNGLFVDPAGVELRFVDSNLSSRYVRIDIFDWPIKLHVTVSFDAESATLEVNDQRVQISYAPTDPTNVTETSIKSYGSYFYLIDGFGIYTNKFINKNNMINAKDFDYFSFTSKRYEAMGSFFSGYRLAELKTIEDNEFLLHPDNYYVAAHIFIPQNEELFDYVTLECSDPTVEITYKLDNNSEVMFTDRESIIPAGKIFSIAFKIYPDQISKTFRLKIKAYYEGDISTATPAKLVLTGSAYYSESTDIKIVDCPQGHYLGGSHYGGTWYEDSPNSIEIAFMPTDLTNETFVFSSSDGEISYGAGGSISGFTAYLNGVLVTNLDDILINQWNHLVITKVSVSDTEFLLNNSQLGGESANIRYLFINAYPSVLPESDIEQMYKIVTSSHKLRLVESLSPIVEGDAEYDSPFLLYSYAWSIISGDVG